ncbi:hypothetical protein CYMTET_29609 [Cymbomonas tetramitiformis]|uniref:LysM domain-containing protein n=1 Tax=Cymbomonas tetramitiformis TaxID=36881 RepID=A0AAE0KUR7_9CHLO|nr:hypothetical protein CYMTET_29609 [Cymbomonas tetramitiformis]
MFNKTDGSDGRGLPGKAIFGFVICFVAGIMVGVRALKKSSRAHGTVHEGDTLYRLGKKYQVPIDEIIRANPSIKDVNQIRIGDKLVLPESSMHNFKG